MLITSIKRISAPEEAFLAIWERFGPANGQRPIREYKVLPDRKFRADFAWPIEKIAVEIEGGVWAYGRHNRPASFIKDCEKYNLFTLAGWRVLRFTTDMLTANPAGVARAVDKLIRNTVKSP